MTLVNRKQISLYEEAEAGLKSLVKQMAQVGAGLLGMLLLTGGNPPALTVGLSVVGGIAFVAWSEEKRLTKFYARQSQLKHNPVIASETERSQLPKYNESELPELILKKHLRQSDYSFNNAAIDLFPELILKERLRQSRYSFNAALTAAVLSTCIIIIGIVLLFSGKVTEGTFTISSGLGASIGSLRLAKNVKDRLDRITKELIDDSD
jgi:hypothetical protein